MSDPLQAPRDVASTFWCAARLGSDDRQLLDLIAQRGLETMQHFKAQDSALDGAQMAVAQKCDMSVTILSHTQMGVSFFGEPPVWLVLKAL